MNVLITGASKGIGAALVKHFAAHTDATIIALARNIELLKNLQHFCAKEYHKSIHIYNVDLSQPDFQLTLNAILKEHQHIDIVINNAGFLAHLPFEKTDIQTIQQTFQVNVFAPMLLLQSVFAHLDATKKCHVINIGSMGGFQGSVKFSGLSIYSSSKAALASLTECLAEEYKNRNIYVNCLALGSVQTEMLNNAFPGFKAQTTAEEMAKFIFNFAIQHPLLINGKVIPISVETP
ncbi:MAG: short-chain dehydrogenase [Bacteroidetes bacterium HGW-Bacteroidetes-12]|jgi:short-subunit dehydrogenase|nr:MAG: short-chain dehydrogenase [Bacteroidetes bacterium HGW-Bacteroidetes-12]